MMSEKIERSCWNCQNSGLCYLKRHMEDLIRLGSGMLNIDGDAAPGQCYQDLPAALGMCCMEYKEQSDDPK